MARGINDVNYYANGFAWNKETKECYGIKEANFIDAKETKWQSCIFSGKSSNRTFLVITICHHIRYYNGINHIVLSLAIHGYHYRAVRNGIPIQEGNIN